MQWQRSRIESAEAKVPASQTRLCWPTFCRFNSGDDNRCCPVSFCTKRRPPTPFDINQLHLIVALSRHGQMVRQGTRGRRRVLEGLVVEGLESLNELWAGLYGEFQGFDCLSVVACLGCGAMAGGAEHSCCQGEGRAESSNESKVGRYRFDLRIGEAALHNSQQILDFTGTGGFPS